MSQDAPNLEVLLAELVHRPDWHRDAACRGMGSDLFFIEPGMSADPARAICERCAVRAECLSAALAAGDHHGIWGGLTTRGLRVLRRGAA